jgi:hypothetical protein
LKLIHRKTDSLLANNNQNAGAIRNSLVGLFEYPPLVEAVTLLKILIAYLLNAKSMQLYLKKLKK